MTWRDDPANSRHVARLRELVAAQGRVLIFLGAGLSFGGARLNGRARFDYDRYDDPPPWWPDEPRLARSDDGLPLPSWSWLVSRMHERLLAESSEGERRALYQFFVEEGPLDCAELFRQSVGEANYREFLLDQFDIGWYGDMVRSTPSHRALMELGLPVMFTTNYDELIEATYREASRPLRVSISEQQFMAHRQASDPHLVKLHGSIDQPQSIVLTRSDYAATRRDRQEMLGFLRSQMADGAFLFVGFSLSDPNFNAIHDDLRLLYGMDMPASYTVQTRRNVVKERYLRSLNVNTVWLDDWNELPGFLTGIAPLPG